MKKLITIIGAFIILIFLLPYVLYRYTTMPLHAVAWFLKKQNIEMSGFSGNLTKGFSIETIKSSSEVVDFEFHRINFLYPSLASMHGNGKLVIDEISMDGFKVIIKKTKKNETPEASKNSGKKTRGLSDTDKSPFQSIKHPLLLKKLFAKNGEITLPNQEVPFKLDEMSFEELSLLDTGMQLQSAVFTSNRVDVRLPKIEITSDGSLTMSDIASAAIKPALFSALKQELHIKLQANYKSGEGTSGVSGFIKSFDDKFTAHLGSNGQIQLSLVDLDLRHYLRYTSDMQKISLTIEAQNFLAAMMGTYDAQGAAVIRDQLFQIVKAPPGQPTPIPQFFGISDKNGMRLMVDITQHFKELIQNLIAYNPNHEITVSTPIGMQSSIPQVSSPGDVVSMYFYGKAYKKLNKLEKTQVNNHAQLLGIALPIVPTPEPYHRKPGSTNLQLHSRQSH